MGAAGALLYLWLTMARNRLLHVIRNLYKPGNLLGLAMFAGFMLAMLLGRAAPRREPPEAVFHAFELFAGMLVTVIFYIGWLLPQNNAVMLFTEAETAFLFPAPVRRRLLIHYKMLVGMLFGLFMAMFPALMLVLPNAKAGLVDFLWLLLLLWSISTIQLFQGAIACLLYQRAADRGMARLYRFAVIGIGVGTVLLACVLLSAGNIEYMVRFLPGRLLVHAGFVRGLDYTLWQYLLLALLVLHYWWVLKLETPFEENALALAARRTAMLTGKTAVLRPPRVSTQSFGLGAGAPVELVLLWKNLLTLPSYINRKSWLLALLVVVALMQLLPKFAGDAGVAIARALGGACVMGLTVLMMFAPMVAGGIIGNELSRADLVKSWPVPGWRVILGSLLMPVVVVTALVWLLLLAISLSPLMQGGNQAAAAMTGGRLLTIALAACVVPALQALQLALGFVPALWFPGYLKPGAVSKGGLGLLGTGMLLLAGISLLTALALVPPVLVALVVYYFGQWLASPVLAMTLVTIVSTVVLLTETLFIVHLLGERFERLDIADEMRM